VPFSMRFLRPLSSILIFSFLCVSALAATAETTTNATATASVAPIPVASSQVLPTEFAGWQLQGAVTKSDDPAVADAVDGPVLKEYGFRHLEKATYTRDDGRSVVIKAAVFDDASGAYGAFTYYHSDGMGDETIGGQAAFLKNRVLFFQGNVLVDAVFDKMSVMSASQLRQLAGLLPLAEGNKDKPPSLPARLPRQGLDKSTTKYVLGPIALDRIGSPLPAALVDFNSDAEVVIGKYAKSAGIATLMLIEYPNSQIAAERLRQIDASHKVTQQQPGVTTILDLGPFYDTRTGPIIVIAAGPLSKSEARSLISSVSYEADVTWNENAFATKKDNVGNFLFNAIILCGIVAGLALVAGIAFGGIRMLIKRTFPDSLFNRPEVVEFISLHLEEKPPRLPRER
jgi:hypothetical protein